MASNSALRWMLGIASFSLLVAITVYSFARPYPPLPFESIRANLPVFASLNGLSGSAPSLFYTLAIGLLLGACATTLRAARLHCLLWICLALVLETLQFPKLAGPVSTWLAGILPQTSWEIVRPYWSRGTFDLLDLFATLMGGLIALFLITRLSGSKQDAPDRP